MLGKPTAYRTKSLNFPMMTPRHYSPSPQRQAPRKLECSFLSPTGHQSLSKQSSNPERLSEVSPGAPPDPRPPCPVNWSHSVLMQEHQSLNRNASAPGGKPERAGTMGSLLSSAHGQRKGSISDSQLHLLGTEDLNLDCSEFSDCFSPHKVIGEGSNLFVPSSAVWGSMEYSLGPIPTPAAGPLGPSRVKAYYHLSQLFPESTVAAVMTSNPHETNPQTLCSMILNAHKMATFGNCT